MLASGEELIPGYLTEGTPLVLIQSYLNRRTLHVTSVTLTQRFGLATSIVST